MKKLITKQLMIVAAMAFVGVTGVAQASDDDEGACSVATLRGLYVFAASGYNIVGGAAQPKAILESIRFDGNGTLTVPVGNGQHQRSDSPFPAQRDRGLHGRARLYRHARVCVGPDL
jgi:hypothetical protein